MFLAKQGGCWWEVVSVEEASAACELEHQVSALERLLGSFFSQNS